MVKIQKFDIIVIGAGPGGSAAAMVAAEKGYSVCIIEKEILGTEGRYKACGGAIAWELVDEVNYPVEKIGRVIESLELHHIDGETFSKKGKGAVVWRSTFDNYLTKLAVKSGAVLHESEQLKTISTHENSYQIQTTKGTYEGTYIMAADGVNSPTLRALKWPSIDKNDMVLTVTKEMKSSKADIDKKLGSDKVHLFFGVQNLIELGYAWLFPKTEQITVGWGNSLPKIKNTKEEFQRFLDVPMVKQTLHNTTQTIYRPHMIPVGVRPKLYGENVFAVGDSGGLVDPISGKGIPYAMMAGKFAVESIVRAEKKGKLEKLGSMYEKKLNTSFLNILKAKREARDRIFANDENLKKFLGLWENHRSSEIVMKKLI